MTSNRINKQCLYELVKGLRGNTSLRVLRLGDNPITASGAYFLLNQMLEMPSSALKEIDLGYQSVEPNFLTLLEQVQQVHPDLQVVYGAVLGQDVESKDEEQELMDENPVVVLMEFGNILGYRLVDLFAMMDKDNSKTLTRMEIKNGLLGCNIPLSEKALDALVHKLDEDGDGEIDYAELIAGKTQHRRKITRTIMMSREQNVNMEETEVGRVRKKLKRLLDKKQQGESSKFKSNIQSVASAVTAVTNQMKKGGGQAMLSEEQQISRPGSARDEKSDEKKTADVTGSSTGGDLLETGVSALTLSVGTDEVDSGGGVGGTAVVSAMPLPTEESAGIMLPKLGLRRGSFYKKLME
ncbi:leucine-rich repeat-containing protein 74A-like [Elysia marginata]|uniref:Leucine-rich repeat-containing protein 74A-like n=1 Tax=Elysia marginata TaxID=1093978 RepID=A0AAV4IVL4_9GAST|nr:leucine-rich repeat-containing protein 74A-like [Elysia marginata]